MLYRMKSMRRREFMGMMGSAAVAWPGIAVSQSGQPMRRIGVLMGTSEGDAEVHPHLITFQKALQELGWTDGRNVQIDYRFAVSDPQRIRAAAAELFGLKQDVLVAQSTPEIRALLELTRIVPIVSPMIADPVGSGLVQSIARPGGNVTGFTNFEEGMEASGSACSGQSRLMCRASRLSCIRMMRNSAAGCEARSRQRRPRSEWD